MAKRSRRRKKTVYFLLVALLVAGCVLAVHHGHHARAVWTGSFAVAVACWIIAVLYPVTCAVSTRQGLACRNPSNGVLFGCSRHTWVKFRARFGRPERVRVPAARTARPAAEVSQDTRGTILFWLAIVATSAGFVSMTTDVIGLFD